MPRRPRREARSPVAPTPREALEYFRFRGLRVGFDYRDVWQGEHALAFTVAKAMETDLLQEIRAALDRALGEGRTFRQFRKALTPVLRERGWWGKQDRRDPLTGATVRAQLGSRRRLRTIYRANLGAARSAGVWDRAQRAKGAHPYFLYEPGPADRGCGGHRAWTGTLLPIDHPWWNDHFPPNGWNCRCRVRPLGEAEARRRGGPTEPPPRNEVPWWNERARRFERADAGLDPAWATNPGKHRAGGPLGYLKEELDPAEAAFARAAIDSLLDSPILPRFRAEPRGDLPAGISDREVRGWFGAKTRLARLPDRIMDKQEGRHPDPMFPGHPKLTLAEYRLLPHIIAKPEYVLRYPPSGRAVAASTVVRRLNLIRSIGGVFYNAVAERTEDGAKVEIISLHRINGGRRRVERMARRSLKVFRRPSLQLGGTAPGSPVGPPDGLPQNRRSTKSSP